MHPIVIELHSGSMRQNNWRTRGRSGAHFWRGDLAVAAGYHVICQAIVILGIASRPRVSTLRVLPDGHLKDFYFTCMLADQQMDWPQVVSALDTLSHLIEVDSIQGTRRQLLDQVVRRQTTGEVCMLDLADHHHGCRLWLVVVGVEFGTSAGRRQPTALMVLDANERGVAVAAFNGRLELQSPPSRSRLHYRAVDGSIREVTLGNVVALKRRSP